MIGVESVTGISSPFSPSGKKKVFYLEKKKAFHLGTAKKVNIYLQVKRQSNSMSITSSLKGVLSVFCNKISGMSRMTQALKSEYSVMQELDIF